MCRAIPPHQLRHPAKKDMNKTIKAISEMQRRADQIQREIAEANFDGAAANGLVKVVVSGKGDVSAIKIDPTLLGEDVETLEDLLIVALQNANKDKEAFSKQKLSGLATGLLPMGFKIPGLG